MSIQVVAYNNIKFIHILSIQVQDNIKFNATTTTLILSIFLSIFLSSSLSFFYKCEDAWVWINTNSYKYGQYKCQYKCEDAWVLSIQMWRCMKMLTLLEWIQMAHKWHGMVKIITITWDSTSDMAWLNLYESNGILIHILHLFTNIRQYKTWLKYYKSNGHDYITNKWWM